MHRQSYTKNWVKTPAVSRAAMAYSRKLKISQQDKMFLPNLSSKRMKKIIPLLFRWYRNTFTTWTGLSSVA